MAVFTVLMCKEKLIMPFPVPTKVVSLIYSLETALN